MLQSVNIKLVLAHSFDTLHCFSEYPIGLASLFANKSFIEYAFNFPVERCITFLLTFCKWNSFLPNLLLLSLSSWAMHNSFIWPKRRRAERWGVSGQPVKSPQDSPDLFESLTSLFATIKMRYCSQLGEKQRPLSYCGIKKECLTWKWGNCQQFVVFKMFFIKSMKQQYI